MLVELAVVLRRADSTLWQAKITVPSIKRREKSGKAHL